MRQTGAKGAILPFVKCYSRGSMLSVERRFYAVHISIPIKIIANPLILKTDLHN